MPMIRFGVMEALGHGCEANGLCSLNIIVPLE